MNSDTGKWIMIVGFVIFLIGAAVYFFYDRMHWIGRLPGDIRIEKENFKLYFPLATMILFSLLITLLIHVFRKWF